MYSGDREEVGMSQKYIAREEDEVFITEQRHLEWELMHLKNFGEQIRKNAEEMQLALGSYLNMEQAAPAELIYDMQNITDNRMTMMHEFGIEWGNLAKDMKVLHNKMCNNKAYIHLHKEGVRGNLAVCGEWPPFAQMVQRLEIEKVTCEECLKK